MQTEDHSTETETDKTESFRESSYKHCKTDMLVKTILAAFLACQFGGLWAKYFTIGCTLKEEQTLRII